MDNCKKCRDLRKKCSKYAKSNDLRKHELRQVEEFIQMLKKDGRTNNEELKQYFKSKKKVQELGGSCG